MYCTLRGLGLAITLATILAAPGTQLFAQDGVKLNVNDISFLWPLPETAADANALIAADEKLSDGAELWSPKSFKQVLAAATAPAAGFTVNNQPLAIRLHDPAFQELKNWKVAGIRFDPSAPGCDEKLIAAVGSMPQIRFVMQPVTVTGGKATAHDFAAHVVFDFVQRGLTKTATGEIVPAIPDNAAFAVIVKDLAALKAAMKAKGIQTDGKLGVHPGFGRADFDLTAALREILKKHLHPGKLNHVAFMGIRRPEPWIFFNTNKSALGDFVAGSPRMFFKLHPQKVFPLPTNNNLGAVGVSTAPLLQSGDSAQLESAATGPAAGLPRAPKVKEIPDIIANPRIANVLNTDCVSCHTETSLRMGRGLAPAATPFVFAPPAGMEGVKDELLSRDTWNVRNFGWGVPLSGVARATVSQRTANEAAEAAEFVNKHFLAPAQPTGVSNALTLVMKAKDAEHARQLKELVTKMQSLPPNQNPIAVALEKLGNVHFARFVFLDDKTLAVITTYDDDFDTYIDLFIDEIGDVFNLLLQHIDGAPAKKVQEDREAFRAFVRKHDLPITGTQYSAYPKLRVQDIKAFESQGGTPKPE